MKIGVSLPTLSLLSLAVTLSWSSTHLRASSFLQMLGKSLGRPFWLAHPCRGPPSAAKARQAENQHDFSPRLCIPYMDGLFEIQHPAAVA